MPVLWGHFDRVDRDVRGTRWILVTTVLPGGTAIRARALLGNQTLIARGIAQVELADLRDGDFVEVTYHRGHAGFLEADSIYARPNDVALQSG